MIILPCPKRPDLDCIAGAVAYAAYLTHTKGQPAKAWICGEPDGEAQFHLNANSDLVFATDAEAAAATEFVLIDFSVKTILPSSVDPAKVTHVIDHRLFTHPAKDFPRAVIQLEQVGAAATLVTEYYMRDAVTPSAALAGMLYGAIYTHTICLNSTTTTTRDRQAVAWLKPFVADADDLIERQLQSRRREIVSQMPTILRTEMKYENSRLGQYGFSLLELQHAHQFWQERQQDIIHWAQTQDMPVLVNILDPLRNECVIYSSASDYTALLETQLYVRANDNVLMLQPALFRKQIIPLLF